jgi:hypothetical protein
MPLGGLGVRRSRLPVAVACLVLAGAVGVGILTGGTRKSSVDRAAQASRERQLRREQRIRKAASRERRAAAKVVVPRLIAEHPGAVRRELRARGLKVSFVSHTYAVVCGGPWPEGRVVAQRPDPGAHFRPGGHVAVTVTSYVQTGCGRSVAAPPCRSGQLSLRVVGGRPDYPGGSDFALVGVDVRHVHGPRCEAQGPLQVEMDRPQGTMAGPMRGNPATLHLQGTLGRGDTLKARWEWASWCDGRGGVVGVANSGGLSASDKPEEFPTCLRRRSSLGLFALDRF